MKIAVPMAVTAAKLQPNDLLIDSAELFPGEGPAWVDSVEYETDDDMIPVEVAELQPTATRWLIVVYLPGGHETITDFFANYEEEFHVVRVVEMEDWRETQVLPEWTRDLD